MERTVLVTGAGSGIGLATAVHLSCIGFSVAGLVIDDAEAAALEEEARRREVVIRTIEADLGEPSQCESLLEGLDLWALVNNAGYLNGGQLRDVRLEEARRQFEVMVFAPLDLVLRALPQMIRRGDGRIVNMSFSAAHATTPLSGWYSASKAALRELTDALRLELEGTGVEVLDIEPGAFDTAIWDRAAAEFRQRQARSLRPEGYERALHSLGRIQSLAGDPQKVAEAVGEVLTTARLRPHRRVGPDASPLRVITELVPDRFADGLLAHSFLGGDR